nr:MAG TPA: hypothetical protein [Caudoviricetes sp.]
MGSCCRARWCSAPLCTSPLGSLLNLSQDNY